MAEGEARVRAPWGTPRLQCLATPWTSGPVYWFHITQRRWREVQVLSVTRALVGDSLRCFLSVKVSLVHVSRVLVGIWYSLYTLISSVNLLWALWVFLPYTGVIRWVWVLFRVLGFSYVYERDVGEDMNTSMMSVSCMYPRGKEGIDLMTKFRLFGHQLHLRPWGLFAGYWPTRITERDRANSCWQ